MTTLKDLSNALGLSVTQVSRALNGHSDVNEKTRARVEKVAKELNYQPNVAARSLVSGRTGVVGLVLSKEHSNSDDGYLLKTVAGLSERFSASGIQFILHISPDTHSVTESYQRLIDGRTLDGFVLEEPVEDDERIKYLLKRKVPFVVHGRTRSPTKYPYFDIDNEGVGYQSARHLIERGHKKIAMVLGDTNRCYVIDRIRGYKAALAESRIKYNKHFIHTAPMTEANGMVSAVKLLEEPDARPSAIICGNVRIAKGVYHVANAMNIQIPEQLSVIAHDDVLPEIRASAFYPAMTVTRSPLSDSWAPLAASLTAAINGGPVKELQTVADFELVERSSVIENLMT